MIDFVRVLVDAGATASSAASAAVIVAAGGSVFEAAAVVVVADEREVFDADVLLTAIAAERAQVQV